VQIWSPAHVLEMGKREAFVATSGRQIVGTATLDEWFVL
jgi:hypothetical protein